MKDFIIKISYSWGNKEHDIEIQKISRIEAFMYMLDLAKQEISNTIYDGHEEDSFNLKVEPNNSSITLTYEYDNEMCYYKLISKVYCIIISEFDEFGNRINSWVMGCNTNFDISKEHWKQYDERLRNGEFSFCGKNSKVELKVRDYETNDLIEIIEEV